MAYISGLLVGVALQAVLALEAVTGMPIAILERTGDDPKAFWARTTEILCDKTESYFCDQDVQFMTANNKPMGFARILQYDNAEGQQSHVCALLPPMPGSPQPSPHRSTAWRTGSRCTEEGGAIDGGGS